MAVGHQARKQDAGTSLAFSAHNAEGFLDWKKDRMVALVDK